MANVLQQEDLVLNIIVNGNSARSDIGKVSRELSDSKKRLESVNAEMKRLERSNQTGSQRYQDLRTQATALNQTITEQRRKLEELNSSLKLEERSLTELSRAYRNIKRQRDLAAPNTENWRQLDEQLKAIRNRMREVDQGASQTGNFLSNLTSRATKLTGALIATGAAVTAMWSGISKATDQYAKFDDVLSDVMKTTNLNKEAVRGLNAELEKIDTRTSQEDLLGLGRIAGKLGYTDTSEIAEFVKANNELVVALNEDLGGDVEETVNKVGKLVDIFKLKDLYTTEDAFRKVGSAINELGAAGTANEGYMVGLAGRLAGIAPLADVSIDKIFGLAATLDQLQQSEEVSGTAISKLWVNMASDADTYSKYAGMKIKDFQNLMEKDFMGAFVKVLQGVRNNSNGINELAATLGDLGQDGGRVIGVLGSLADNTGLLTEKMKLANQSMIEGTSLTKEYNTKNQNAAAELDKARKEVSKFWRELGEKLWPIITSGNNLMSIFLKALITVINFVSDNYKVILLITTAYVSYNAAIAVSNFNLSSNIALTKLKVIWDRAAAAASLLFAAAQMALQGNIVGATLSMAVFNRTVLANPIAIVVAAVTTLGTAFYLKGKQVDTATKYQKSYNEALQEGQKEVEAEKSAIERNLAVALDKNRTDAQRIAATRELKRLMPDHLKAYSDEEIMAGNATKAIKGYVNELIKVSTLKAMQSRLDTLANEKLELQERKRRGFAGASLGERWDAMNSETFFSGDWEKSYADYVDRKIKAVEFQEQRFGEEVIKKQAELSKNLQSNADDLSGAPKVTIVDKKAQKQAEKDAKAAERARKAQEKQDNAIEKTQDYWDSLEEIDNLGMDQQLVNLKKKYNDYLRTTKDNLEGRQKVAEQYAALRLKREHEIDQESAKNELDRQKQLAEQKAQQRQFDIDKEYQEKVNAVINSSSSERDKSNELASIEEQNRRDKLTAQEEDLATRYLMLEAAISVGDLEIEEAKRVAQEKAKIQSDLVNLQISEARREQQKREEIEKQTNEAIHSIKLESIKGYEAAFQMVGQFFEENTAAAKIFLILEKAAAAATVIISLQKEIAGYYAAAAMVPYPLNAAALALATKQSLAAKIRAGISLVTIAGTTIKGITAKSSSKSSSSGSSGSGAINNNQRISGREDGGYFDITREQDNRPFKAKIRPDMRGFVNQPTVLVGESGREWVANDKLVTNPTTGPVIAWLDSVQRNGAINPAMLSNVIRSTMMPGRASGGSFSNSENNSSMPLYDPRMIEVLDTLSTRVNELGDKMQNIRADVSLLGKNGFIEQMRQLESDQDAGTL